MFCWCCSRHLRWSSAFFSAFFYVTMISFSSSVSFLPFFPWFIAYICIYPPKDELYIFLNVWSSSREECVTQTWRRVSRWVGAVRDAPHVCSVDTATWSLPPFLCVVWCSDPWKSPGIRSPSSDLWTSRSTRFGLTPLWLRMQWLWTEGAMLVQMCPVKYGKVFLQHARLLASFPIGVYSDRAPESAWTDSGKHISCGYTAFEALLNHMMARKWSLPSFMCRQKKKTHIK